MASPLAGSWFKVECFVRAAEGEASPEIATVALDAFGEREVRHLCVAFEAPSDREEADRG